MISSVRSRLSTSDRDLRYESRMALSKIIGFAITTDAAKARAFYGGMLGFRFVSDDDYAVVFDANGTTLRLQKAQQFTPAQHTILGWEVVDIHSEIRALTERGVKFEQFGQAFMPQDELGVWTTPDGSQVAWFKDPDGNTLSLSRHMIQRSRTTTAKQ